MQINKAKKYMICSLLGFIVMFLLPVYGFASGGDIGVRPLPPENHRGTHRDNYFDLIMEPGSTQMVYIEVSNNSKEDKDISIILSNATTAESIIVDYRPQDNMTYDESLPYPIENLLATDEQVKIPAGETIDIPIEVTMPADKFDGILACGISISEMIDAENESTGESGMSMSIDNRYRFDLALLMRQNENLVDPELQCTVIGAAQKNARNVVRSHLQNPKPAFINQVEIETTVISLKNGEEVLADKQTHRQIAPNSKFDYNIFLNGEPFVAGEYEIKIDVTSDKGNWQFVDTFAITREEAREFNALDVTIERTSTWFFVMIGASTLFIIFLVFLIIMLRKKKR